MESNTVFEAAGLRGNEVHVRATWQCAACPACATRSFMIPARLFIVDPPEGWQLVAGETYCPRHTVKIETNNLREMPPLETRAKP